VISGTPPRRPSRTTGRLMILIAAAGLAMTALAGCQILGAYTGLPLGGADDGFSDDPDPCASASDLPGSQYRTGSATVTFSDGSAPLKLTLQGGQYVPADAGSATLDCFGAGSEAAYQDSAGVWMLSIEIPNDGPGTTSPSTGPSTGTGAGQAAGAGTGQATVFLLRTDNARAGQAVQSDSCYSALKETGPKGFSGTVTCQRVVWMGEGPGGSGSTSSAPFDMTVTFTATP